MIKKLTAIGNSYGLLIDKAILDILKITPDTELELSTDDGTRLIIEPLPKKARRPPAPAPRHPPAHPKRPRPEPRYGFPKKQPW